MKVLMITGDKSILEAGSGAHARFELQRAQVEELAVVYWGAGSLWPTIPREVFDVVTVQDPFWRGFFGWFVAWRKRAKLNVQVHTDLLAQPMLRHVLSQIVLRHADSIRVVSEKIKKQVEHVGVQAKITVLPIYINVDSYRCLTLKPHPKKTILWIGRFEVEKDPLYAIEVFKAVRKKSVDAKLVLLGKGSLSEKLTEMAAENPDLQIETPGWQDTRMYLEVADVVLSTSRHESWGASIIEALAAGVPVVAPDLGIAREAGAIVVPRHEMAEAVARVLNSDSRGELKLPLLNKEEWAKKWLQSL